jgi:hypothetical protein
MMANIISNEKGGRQNKNLSVEIFFISAKGTFQIERVGETIE